MMNLSAHWVRTRCRLRSLVHTVVARSRDARSEAGDTLIEVLLALIVLSLASVALITAFETDISASAEHRNLANFDTALANSLAMTSSVIQNGYTSVFTTCPVPSTSLSAYPSESVLTSALAIKGFTAQIAASGTQPAIEYSGGTTFTTACTNPSANSTGNVGQPQLINVVVTNSATGLSQSDTVIVVDPTPVQAGGSNSNEASQLVFSTQPEGATVGGAFTTQPVIEVLDSNGNIVTSNLSSVTISLDPALGTPGAVLSPCTGQETSGIIVFSGCSINEAGIGYELEAVEGSGTSQLTKYSAPFSVYSAQLATPTITNVSPSATTAGALTVTFTSPPNSQAFTARACTDEAMSLNCVTAASIISGGSITGLMTQGTSYYVQVTATATGSYLASTTPPYLPAVQATVQLLAPSGVVATTGTVAGSLVVNFTPTTPIAPNQEYTVAACTNITMKQGCVTNSNYTPGSNLTGLTYTAGSSTPSNYYVDVLANGSTGYLASLPSTPPVQSSAVENSVVTPTFSTSPSASQVGSITATYAETGTVTASSFTATVCTNSAMTAGCFTVSNYASNSQISGLTPGSSYYVTITAVSTTPGYASVTTAASPATMATVQLLSPTGVSATYGTAAGTISVSFTPPATIARGQTYTVLACTNSGMTGCVTDANYVAGSNFSPLLAYTQGSPGTTYYIEVTANPSTGYLVSPASSQVSQADTSQLLAPTGISAAYGTTAGSIQVNFTPPTTVAAGQTYTLDACTNKNMTGCVTNANYVALSNETLPFTQGAVGTTYYVEVLSNASAAYVASGYSAQANHAQMSEVDTPVITRVQTGTGTGDISITFSEGGTTPTSYTALACNNMGMTGASCVTKTGYTSGSQFTGLVSGTNYYVTITAIGPTGYLPSTSTVSGVVKAK